MTGGDATTSPRALLARLAATPATLAAALQDRASDALLRRPGEHAWSATEIVCHLRDVEELFQLRVHSIVAIDDPVILVLGADASELARWRIGGRISHPLDPDRWAEDRQYRRAEASAALAAFRRRRDDVLVLLHGLDDAQWRRRGVHLRRGALSLGEWVSTLAAHDDNHVDQLQRALDGRA